MQVKNIRYVLVFCLGLILFNWPVLSIAGSAGADTFFLYLFSAWIFIIALICILNGVSGPDRSAPRSETDQTDSGPDAAGAGTENSAPAKCKEQDSGQAEEEPHV